MSLGNYTDYNKKRILRNVNSVNSLEQKYASITHSKDKKTRIFTYYDSTTGKYYNESVLLSDEEYEFRKYTEEFKKLLRNGESIESIMNEAIALCREATRRRLSMFQYDCQVEAAVAMQDNCIVEMKTGEGKTLVQILSAYLGALEATKDLDKTKWKSVHVLTANEYLAKRDKEDNESVFSLLGLTTGYAIPQSEVNKDKRLKEVKKKEYSSDIVYGTAKTVAFDYLKDNRVYKVEDKYIRKPMYKAIVDEADDILLDQATRPLILSQSKKDNDMQALYKWAIKFINGEAGYRNKPIRCRIFNQYDKNKNGDIWEYIGPNGRKVDYDSVLFLDNKYVFLSESLYEEIYKNSPYLRNVRLRYSPNEIEKAISQCILAREFYKSGKQYQLTRDNNESIKAGRDIYKVVLTDSSTGRSMDATRYEGGLQEAIEANEGYNLEKYNKLHGTNYGLSYSKKNEVVAKVTYPDFLKLYEGGISGMTGTSDIDEFSSIYGLETYSVMPRIPSIRQDLDSELYISEKAKFDAIIKEIKKCRMSGQPVLVGTTNVAESDRLCTLLRKEGIVFQRLDAVNESNENNVKLTAGKEGMVTVATNMAGRGIDIKLSDKSKELGGLYVIGTSKNRNIRIDNQLRGRSGRQGDPGKTKYFMSLDDELVRMRYGSNFFDYYKSAFSDVVTPIKNKRIVSIVNKCQLAEEGYQKDIRKSTELRDSKVFSKYKNIIYSEREKVLRSSDGELSQMIKSITSNYVKSLFKKSDKDEILAKISHCVKIENCMDGDNISEEKVLNELNLRLNIIDKRFSNYYEIIKYDFLKIIDDYWISFMNRLEEIWLNCTYYSYSSQDPIEIFEREAMNEFIELNSCIKNEIITYSIYPVLEYGRYEIKNVSTNEEKERGRKL